MKYLLKRLAMHFAILSFIAAVTLVSLKPLLLPEDGYMPNWVNDAELLFYQLIFLSALTVFAIPAWIFYDSLRTVSEQALRLEMKRNEVVRAMYYLHIDVPRLTKNQVIAKIAQMTKN